MSYLTMSDLQRGADASGDLVSLGQAAPSWTGAWGAQPTATPSPVTASQPPAQQPGIATARGYVPITDPKLVAWITNPDATAQAEYDALFKSLGTLRDDSRAYGAYFKTLAATVKASSDKLQQTKARYQSIKQQGMGELLGLEILSGQLSDPQALSGFFDSIRKAFSSFDKAVLQPVTHPVNQVLKAFDKNVLQPVAHPIGGVLKQFDKNVLQPVAHPIGSVLNKFDKAVIQPVAHPVGDALHTLDKVALRPVYQPTVKFVGKTISTLDKYVPGWSTLLDFVVPLPIGTILSSAVGSTAGAVLSAARGGTLLTGIGLPDSGLVRLGSNVLGVATQHADQVFKTANEIVSPVQIPLKVAGDFAQTFPLTLTKGTHTFISTKGSLLQKLEATGVEALSGFALAVSLAATVVSFGTVGPAMLNALTALNLALTALKTGVDVLRTAQAAQALKEAARKAREAAAAQIAKIQAEEAAYEAQIAQLEAQIKAIKDEAARLRALKKKAPTASGGGVFGGDSGAGPIAQMAQQVGVSQTTLILGSLAAVGGVIVLLGVVRQMKSSDEDELTEPFDEGA